MARALHNKKRLSDKEYKKVYSELKNAVSYKYDMRKKLTPGQKGAIRRSLNAAVNAGLKTNSQATLQIPPKKPRESKAAYSRRLTKIKAAAGQADSPLKGVVIAIPDNAKKVNFDNGEIVTKGVTKKGGTYTERIDPVDPVDYASDPIGAYTDIAQQIQADGYTEIIPLFRNVSRGPMFELPDNIPPFTEEDEDLWIEFSDFMDSIGEAYGTTEIFTGFIGFKYD